MALIWGADHVLLYNEAYIPLLAERHPGSFGATLASVWPELLDFNTEVCRAVFAGRALSLKEQPLTLKGSGGSEHMWFDLNYTPVFGHDGAVDGVLCSVQVVTERVMAQRALAESEQRYREIVELSHGIIVLARRKTISFMNAAGQRILGLERSTQLQGASLDSLFWPGSDAIECIARLWDNPGYVGPSKTRLKLWNGASLEVEYSASSFKLEDEIVVQIVCAEVVEDGGVHEQLRQQQELIRIAGREAEFGSWRADLVEHSLSLSPEAARLYGLEGASNLALQDALERFFPVDQGRVKAVLTKIADEGLPFDMEFNAQDANGQDKIFRLLGNLIADNNKGNIVQGIVIDITAVRNAENKANATAKSLTIMLESMTEAFFTLDADWNFTFLNTEAQRLLRCGKDEVVGRPFAQFFPRNEAAEFFARYERAMISGEKQAFEEYYQPFDAWFAVAAYPSSEGLAVYFQDITVRRNADEQLRLLEKSMSRTNDMVLITEAFPYDEPGPRIVFANQAFYRDMGYEPKEVLGQSPRLLQGERTSREALDQIRSAIEQRHHIRVELLNYTKDRREIWLELDISPVLDDAGNLTHFVAIQRDVTERKQTQAALAQSEERFRSVAKAFADAIWDRDLLTGTVWWNDGLAQLFQHDSSRFSSDPKAWENEIDARDREQVRESLETALAGNDAVWSASYRFRRGDGSIAHVEDRGFIMRDDSGRALRMVGGMKDVTSLTLLREKVMQVHRLEAVGQLTGGVGHDFNNLLTIIFGNAEVLSEELPEGSRLARMAEMIKDAAQSGAELTHRLLAFARQQPLDASTTNVNRLLVDMEGLLRRTLTEEVELRLACDPDAPSAIVDASQFEAAILNLVLNARDALGTAGKIEISTRRMLEGEMQPSSSEGLQEYLAVIVSDNGAGMSADVMQRAFEPFFTTKPVGHGSGLGLSMVYGFVTQSNGHVLLESEIGKGTTITLCLPLGDRYENELPKTETDVSLMVGTERILLVEDNESVRQHVKELLENMGYSVVAAENGQRAIEILHQFDRIDLLFTDIVMPGGLSGWNVAESARDLYPNLPIVVSSGYRDHRGDRSPPPSLRDIPVLTKPYRRRDLADVLQRTLRGRREDASELGARRGLVGRNGGIN